MKNKSSSRSYWSQRVWTFKLIDFLNNAFLFLPMIGLLLNSYYNRRWRAFVYFLCLFFMWWASLRIGPTRAWHSRSVALPNLTIWKIAIRPISNTKVTFSIGIIIVKKNSVKPGLNVLYITLKNVTKGYTFIDEHCNFSRFGGP